MTVSEFYTKINGDYRDMLLRLPNDDFILRFIKRFPAEPTFNELMAAIEKGDIKASFEASHKLKGIAANLAFTELYKAVYELTEQLRPCTDTADSLIVNRVCNSYHCILNEIRCLEND